MRQIAQNFILVIMYQRAYFVLSPRIAIGLGLSKASRRGEEKILLALTPGGGMMIIFYKVCQKAPGGIGSDRISLAGPERGTPNTELTRPLSAATWPISSARQSFHSPPPPQRPTFRAERWLFRRRWNELAPRVLATARVLGPQPPPPPP
jgi:hypothetical protein